MKKLPLIIVITFVLSFLTPFVLADGYPGEINRVYDAEIISGDEFEVRVKVEDFVDDPWYSEDEYRVYLYDEDDNELEHEPDASWMNLDDEFCTFTLTSNYDPTWDIYDVGERFKIKLFTQDEGQIDDSGWIDTPQPDSHGYIVDIDAGIFHTDEIWVNIGVHDNDSGGWWGADRYYVRMYADNEELTELEREPDTYITIQGETKYINLTSYLDPNWDMYSVGEFFKIELYTIVDNLHDTEWGTNPFPVNDKGYIDIAWCEIASGAPDEIDIHIYIIDREEEGADDEYRVYVYNDDSNTMLLDEEPDTYWKNLNGDGTWLNVSSNWDADWDIYDLEDDFNVRLKLKTGFWFAGSEVWQDSFVTLSLPSIEGGFTYDRQITAERPLAPNQGIGCAPDGNHFFFPASYIGYGRTFVQELSGNTFVSSDINGVSMTAQGYHSGDCFCSNNYLFVAWSNYPTEDVAKCFVYDLTTMAELANSPYDLNASGTYIAGASSGCYDFDGDNYYFSTYLDDSLIYNFSFTAGGGFVYQSYWDSGTDEIQGIEIISDYFYYIRAHADEDPYVYFHPLNDHANVSSQNLAILSGNDAGPFEGMCFDRSNPASIKAYFGFSTTGIYERFFFSGTWSDNVDPQMATIETPEELVWSVSPVLGLTFTDNYWLDKAYWDVDDVTPDYVLFSGAPGAVWTTDWEMNTTVFDGLGNGDHTLYFKAHDLAGNTDLWWWEFTKGTGNASVVASFVVYQIEDSMKCSFIDDSYGINAQVVFWNWDFGDGQSSDDRNPYHTFSDYGNKTITLVVENETTGVKDQQIAHISLLGEEEEGAVDIYIELPMELIVALMGVIIVITLVYVFINITEGVFKR